MEFILIFGTAISLLILFCWIISRRLRSTSKLSDQSNAQHESDFFLAGDAAENFYDEDDIELGSALMSDLQEPLELEDSPEPRVDESNSADYWDWQDDVRFDNIVKFQDPANDEFVEHSSDDAEDQVWAATGTYHKHLEPLEQSDDAADSRSISELSYESENHHVEEHHDETNSEFVEPDFAIQVRVPLRSTEANGHEMEMDSMQIEQIEVDESIEFPDFSSSSNRAVEMLCWIPADGAAVSRTHLLALVRDFGESIELPVALYGKLVDSDTWVNFKEENVSARFADLMFTMQLTHYGKSMDEQSWWQFYNMAERIAESLSRPFFPSLSLESALHVSRNLTEQVDNLNLQAILILQSKNKSMLSDRTLDYLAREYDLVKLKSGEAFEKIDPLQQGSAPIYTLSTVLPSKRDNDHMGEEFGLALYCNLPCTSDPLNAFDQMVDLARDLESRFPLVLVDEDRNRVSTREIDVIRTHLQSFVDDMKYCRIVPGSEVAMRLFNQPSSDQKGSETSQLLHFAPER